MGLVHPPINDSGGAAVSDTIDCPKCGHEHHSEGNGPQLGLFNASCIMCSKPFQIEVSLKISASRIVNNVGHKIIEDEEEWWRFVRT